jgi:hypothetical protein
MIARAPLALFFGRKIGDVASAGYDASATFASGYFYVTSWNKVLQMLQMQLTLLI